MTIPQNFILNPKDRGKSITSRDVTIGEISMMKIR